jgi:hypothetical protein
VSATFVVLSVTLSVVASLLAFATGRMTAPKNVTVVHPWSDDQRCPAVLGGLACVQCRFRDGHKGPHSARWDGRYWAFSEDGEGIERLS